MKRQVEQSPLTIFSKRKSYIKQREDELVQTIEDLRLRGIKAASGSLDRNNQQDQEVDEDEIDRYTQKLEDLKNELQKDTDA